MTKLPNVHEFHNVYEEIKNGTNLNLVHIHRIFGQAFFELMILCLCDAKYSYATLRDMLMMEIKNENR